MASYRYRVMVTVVDETHEIAAPPDGWTHGSATHFARVARWTVGGVQGAEMPAGAEIVIERRTVRHDQYGNPTLHHAWMPHRRYVVGEDGIVRREA